MSFPPPPPADTGGAAGAAAARRDAARLVAARGLRGLVDGFVSVWLAEYLGLMGLSPFRIGVVVTATLLGSAALTLAVGLTAWRRAGRTILLAAAGLMLATGAGFALAGGFWALVGVGFLGTLNPSSGDVSVFLPTEQALLAESAAAGRRTALFARYGLAGSLLGALGALGSSLPQALARHLDCDPRLTYRAGFLLYALAALGIAALYLGLGRGRRPESGDAAPRRALARSRPVVLRLAALFALDSFGGGFVVDSMLVLWLLLRFELTLASAGVVFFAARALAAFSQLLSPRLAARFGLIETMVFTHVPANLFLIAAAFMPSAPLAIACLLARMASSQMDVPARQSYVMAVVPPEERAAAASVTNVPRSLAAALAPLLAGALLARSSFGWPLVVGGSLKLTYDFLLLASFRRHSPGSS